MSGSSVGITRTGLSKHWCAILKSERGDTDIDKHINSAIMKTY